MEMAKSAESGKEPSAAARAKWPKQPSKGVATYDKMLRALMTPAHLNKLEKDGAGRARRGAWCRSS